MVIVIEIYQGSCVQRLYRSNCQDQTSPYTYNNRNDHETALHSDVFGFTMCNGL